MAYYNDHEAMSFSLEMVSNNLPAYCYKAIASDDGSCEGEGSIAPLLLPSFRT